MKPLLKTTASRGRFAHHNEPSPRWKIARAPRAKQARMEDREWRIAPGHSPNPPKADRHFMLRHPLSFILHPRLALLLFASYQFSAATPAQTAILPADPSACPFAVATSCLISSSSGSDCITSQRQQKQPWQESNGLSDSLVDLDDSDGDLDDFADSSTRDHQDTPLFSMTGLDAATLRRLRRVPILLFPVHCFYCLHEHIRERAPPVRRSLGVGALV